MIECPYVKRNANQIRGFYMTKNIILMADSQEINRRTLTHILQNEYELLETDSVDQTLELMYKYGQQIAAVILDLDDCERLDGYEVLRRWQEDARIDSIPIIGSVDADNRESELESLRMGIWEHIQRPYDPAVIRFRVKNVIERKELRRFKQMHQVREYDELTGIYNKQMFLRRTKEMLSRNPGKAFAFIHFDIYQFHLVNQFYGMDEADRLLQYIADQLACLAEEFEHFTYGRYRADVFCFCMPFKDKQSVVRVIERIRENMNQYQMEHVLVPVFGICIAEDFSEQIVMISDRANLAAKQCKGNYIRNYSFYEASMSEQIIKEQKIINTMKNALASEQFVLYIQPKYDLHTNMINGGEVLVRWMVPGNEMVPPGEFIPVFERNGFIVKLDYYVWEHTCQMIRKWLDEGKRPFPVSVNISRVSLYNHKLAEVILELVQRYQIEPRLLQLELTESAYTSNPERIKKTMAKLQEYGFCILMDDFGSGYSSLNTLKDIVVDILKIDMKFLSDSEVPGRGENILASVVRMAKWLDMPVIAEGVEKESQVAFLRSIGCEFVQGYYFAKPMPVAEYERLAFDRFAFHKEEADDRQDHADQLWDLSSQMELLFSNMLQAVAIFEYVPVEKIIDTIRVNNAYYDLFGYSDLDQIGNGIHNAVDESCRGAVFAAFETVSASKRAARCEFSYTNEKGTEKWIEMSLKYVRSVGKRSVIFATMTDITDQKEIERELRKYRKAILSSESKVETILIVDDMVMNRQILRIMFESEYNILEAADGKEALKIAKQNSAHIDLILLDVRMPVMDGREFLQRKREDLSIAHIPVIIITADDSRQQQINALSMGANDYVVKPFIPEVVIRRVCNVLESQKRVGEVLQSAQKTDTQEQHDYLTGLYNRNTAGRMIHDALQQKEGLQALLFIDIDNFKQINDCFGQEAGDKGIQRFADWLRSCFRKSDILARYGGDEFIVFVMDVPSREFIEQKCTNLLQEMHLMIQNEIELEFSVGIAVTTAGSGQESFMELMEHADDALHKAKCRGKNQWYIYEGN